MVDILFATDFSTISVSAGHFAGLYARQLGARLHLLHVLHRSDPRPDPNHRLSELALQIGAPQDSITEVVTGAAPGEHCVVCTEPSRDLICGSCRARIRGHALDRRLQEMRTGPG